MPGPTLYERGYTAARQAYVAAVKAGEGPSITTKMVIDAYLLASGKRTERVYGSQILNEMPPAIRHLVIRVAHKCGMSADSVAEKYTHNPDFSRRQHATCRAEIWRTLYATGQYSFPQIGRWFRLDHSTILHGVKGGPQRAPYIEHDMRRPPRVR